MMRRLFAWFVPGFAVLAASCSPSPDGRALASKTPVFSAQRFFAGHTRGDGKLKIIFSTQRRVIVHGDGRIDADGVLILDQAIDQPGKSRSLRQWRIRETAPGRYVGALTDTIGPVTGEASGNTLHLRFSAPGDEAYEQWLFLSPNAQSARNLMTVRKWGIVVATLDETITKTP